MYYTFIQDNIVFRKQNCVKIYYYFEIEGRNERQIPIPDNIAFFKKLKKYIYNIPQFWNWRRQWKANSNAGQKVHIGQDLDPNFPQYGTQLNIYTVNSVK